MLDTLKETIIKGRQSRKILLFIVYIALFLDNMLLTTVVPIIPEYLFRLEHPNDTDKILAPSNFAGRHGNSRVYRVKTVTVPPTVPPRIVPPKLPPPTSQAPNYFTAYNTEQGFQEAEDGWRIPPPPTTTLTTPPPQSLSEGPNISESAQDKIRAELRHKLIAEENIHVGLMFGSKALVQLITNPFIGPLTNKIGYTVPMFVGFVIMFFSTVLFAFGDSYGVLFFARTLQGIGSACTSTSGMGMLAQAYPDDQERGSAMGVALGGLALGVLVGPPYGGILYQISGKELPFLILAFLALADGTLQFFMLQPRIDRGEPEGTGLKELATDPYIVIAAGSITIGNLGIAMLEPSLPLWMMDTMHAGSATRGAAFLPCAITYLIGTNIFGPLAHKIGRWLSSLIGLVVIGFCLISIPSATSVGGLIAPMGFMGFAIGMIDASMFPQMGYLVDLRHVSVYGSIYAIGDAAFCFAFALGPFFAGPIVSELGFPAMMYMIAVINFLYAPLKIFLRNPPARREEKEPLVNHDVIDGGSQTYARFGSQNSVDRADYERDY